MAFEKIKFAMKTWKDAVSGGTPITAAELNRIEKGISDCATQTNTLGDSVSRCTTFEKAGADSISFAWATLNTEENRLQVRVNGTLVLSLKADFPDE